MNMKKILSKLVAIIVTAALLVSYAGVTDVNAATLETDSEETSVAYEEETTDDASKDAAESEAEDEQTDATTEEVTTEAATEDILEDSQETQDASGEEAANIENSTEENTEETSGDASETESEDVTTENAADETTEIEEEATESASLMAASDYKYSIVSSSAKTIEITGYTGSATSITIPSEINGYTVKTIGEYAFKDSSIKSVTIPSTVTTIGEGAFRLCDELTSITIPDSIKSIGDGAFEGCAKLTSIKIPDSVKSIGERAFASCTKLKSISLSDNITSISYSLFSCCSSLGSIEIPDGVKSIGECAFWDCVNLKSIVMPDSVKTIDDCAFLGCTSLTSMTIPEGVTSIGCYAFLESSVTSVTIPSSVTSIGTGAFVECVSLIKITVNSNNTKYSSKNGVLYNKKKTKLICCPAGKNGSFSIPSGVTDIGVFAFYGCEKLKSITIPNTVESIDSYVFSYCYGLTYIGIPSSIKSIGMCVFENCKKLTYIYYAGSKTKWDKISFYADWNYGCPSNMTIIYNIKSVNVKTSAFTYSGGAKKAGVVIKDGNGNTLSSKYYTITYKNNKDVGTATMIIKLKNGYSGTITKTFKINPKGTSVSSVSCENSCDSFTIKWGKQSAKMSSSRITGYQIQYSTSSSFSSGNKTITVSGYSKTSKKITGLKANTKYYVRIRTYKSVNGTKFYSGWSSAKSITTESNDFTYEVLSSSKKTIEITGYTGNDTKVTIPSTINGYKVTSIGSNVFTVNLGKGEDNETVTSITIPSTVTSIADYAFSGCLNLTSVTIPSTVTDIGKYAFAWCESLKSITIPKSVTSIGDGAFAGCVSLTKITVNSNNKKFSSENGVLYNKKKTKLICCPGGKKGSFSIPSSVTSIGNYAFYDCKITSIKIPNSVKSIGEYAFSESDLISVVIPKGVTSIKDETFFDCVNLKSVIIPDSVTKIGNSAFCCCNLTSIDIPDSVKSIGISAFATCEELTCVEIPSSVTSIGASAFRGCLVLTDIFYAGTEANWNKISFGENWNDECPANMEVHYNIKSVTLKTTSYTYSGSAKTPGVTVKDSSGNTISSSNYTVTYKNNKNVGTATATITFKNDYSGTITRTFKINPKGTSLSSVSKGSKSFTVKWKKQSTKMSTSTITGYEIQYSTSSSFSSGNKSVTVNGYTSTSKKITGLKSKTKYYVRIRTYKSISGTKYYSSWSSAKSVTTK